MFDAVIPWVLKIHGANDAPMNHQELQHESAHSSPHSSSFIIIIDHHWSSFIIHHHHHHHHHHSSWFITMNHHGCGPSKSLNPHGSVTPMALHGLPSQFAVWPLVARVPDSQAGAFNELMIWWLVTVHGHTMILCGYICVYTWLNS